MIIYSPLKNNIYPNRNVLSSTYQNRTLTWKGNFGTNDKKSSETLDYNSKLIDETYNGSQHTPNKNVSAPMKIQEIAKLLQQKSKGNARIEYNSETKHYEIVQTNVFGKDIQEIRTVLNNKAWQEHLTNTETYIKASKDFIKNFSFIRIAVDLLNGNIFNCNAVKAYNAAKKNLESQITPEDYIQTQTTTYTNGKIVKGTYKEGQLKTLSAITEGMSTPVDSTVITGKAQTKLNVAVKFSFKNLDKMPPAGKEFATSLIQNKEKIMLTLGIDNDTYNMLAQTAIGIAKQETNFGQKSARQVVKNIIRTKNDFAAYLQQKLGLENKGNTFSQGITQLKFTQQIKDPWVNKKMKALGITNELQLKKPQNSAIATMVVLQKMNMEARTEAVKKGIFAAQGTSVSLAGYYLDINGIARKANPDHPAAPWANNITRQDILCAYWNGKTRRAVANGIIKPAVWTYSNNVRKYTQIFELVEDKVARKLAEEMVKVAKTCKI